MNDSTTDMQALLDRLPFDEATLRNLARADENEMRAMLTTYLDDSEVDQILERVRQLVKSVED